MENTWFGDEGLVRSGKAWEPRVRHLLSLRHCQLGCGGRPISWLIRSLYEKLCDSLHDNLNASLYDIHYELVPRRST